jgi:tetratricopeptide (TPR) repeat protein
LFEGGVRPGGIGLVSLLSEFINEQTVGRLGLTWTQTRVEAEQGRAVWAAESRPSTDFKARDLAARAGAKVYDQTPEATAEASDLAEEVIRIDPSNPVAHRVRGYAFFSRIWFGDIPHNAANVARGLELARAVLRLAPREEYAHWLMAYAHGEAGQLEDAVADCERGLEINPNCSAILGDLGGYLGALGRPQEAIEACRLALQLDPRNPVNFWNHFHIARAHFVAADYDTALQESRKIARSRSHLQSAIIWAPAAAALGKAEEARAAVENCLAQRSDLRVSRVAPSLMLRFARDEDHERLLALLRKAGLPE